jgi:hypothetical protein
MTTDKEPGSFSSKLHHLHVSSTPRPGNTRQSGEDKGASVIMAMKPMHRLAHQLERPDGGVEWACPQCGHYLVCYRAQKNVLLSVARRENCGEELAGLALW